MVAKVVQLRGNGALGRQFGIAIAFLGDQLAAHFGRRPAGIEALGAELGVGLALTIHNGLDVC